MFIVQKKPSDEESHRRLIKCKPFFKDKETQKERNEPAEETKSNSNGREIQSLILQELECGQPFEDMHLLLLLRRYCRQGAFENFDYLLKSKFFSREDHT